MGSIWSWGQKRQVSYILIFSTIIFIIVAVFLTTKFLIKPPEVVELTGDDPVVMWSNAFPVGGNIHGAIAQFVNTEAGMGSPEAYYKFSFFDNRGRLISEKRGRTFFRAGESFFVFERELDFDETPAWTSFSWEKIRWTEKGRPYDKEDYNVEFSDINLRSDIPTPRLEARIENKGLLEIPSVEVVALIIDEYENTVTASRGVTSEIPFRGGLPLTLSWPGPFAFSKNVCDPPLSAHVAVLNGNEENEFDMNEILTDFEKEMEEGFSWTLSSNKMGENETGVTAISLRSEARFLNSRENPIILVLFPEYESRIVSLRILSGLEEYDFVKPIGLREHEEGGLQIDKSEIESILNRNCIQAPRDIRLYTRILN